MHILEICSFNCYWSSLHRCSWFYVNKVFSTSNCILFLLMTHVSGAAWLLAIKKWWKLNLLSKTQCLPPIWPKWTRKTTWLISLPCKIRALAITSLVRWMAWSTQVHLSLEVEMLERETYQWGLPCHSLPTPWLAMSQMAQGMSCQQKSSQAEAWLLLFLGKRKALFLVADINISELKQQLLTMSSWLLSEWAQWLGTSTR